MRLRGNDFSSKGFRDEMLAYLPNESNSLLFSMALSYLGDCQRIFPSDSRPLEPGLVEDRDNESRIPTSFAGVSFVSFDSGFGGGGTTPVYVMAGTESSERLVR